MVTLLSVEDLAPPPGLPLLHEERVVSLLPYDNLGEVLGEEPAEPPPP